MSMQCKYSLFFIFQCKKITLSREKLEDVLEEELALLSLCNWQLKSLHKQNRKINKTIYLRKISHQEYSVEILVNENYYIYMYVYQLQCTL